MTHSRHIFFLMNHFFYGFGLSVVYGALCAVGLYLLYDLDAVKCFLENFYINFNCAVSGGLLIGAALLIHQTQSSVPEKLEQALGPDICDQTTYKEQKSRYLSPQRSALFCGQFIIVGASIFYFAKFPSPIGAEISMILFGCIQYACGVYVGRKMFYIAQMLNAVEDQDVTEELFDKDALASILIYVNAVSIITISFVYMHVMSYFYAPFQFSSFMGSSIKILLVLPAVLATPVVVLFNFYPKNVVKKLYSKSIDMKSKRLSEQFKNDELSTFERLSYFAEFENMANEELKYRLRITLSDIAVAIPIIIAALSLLK